jgi:hypothetical protein
MAAPTDAFPTKHERVAARRGLQRPVEKTSTLRLLTIVTVPDPEVEEDRDLLQSRQQLMQQQESLRRHMRSLLYRNGLHYKAETERKTHWLTHHYGRLNRTIEG